MNWLFGWSIHAAWEYIASTATLANLIGAAAVAVAILLPKPLDFITDLRKWAIVVAVIAFGYSSVLLKGYSDGLAVKQSEWDAAVAREAESNEAARAEAERDIGPVSSDRRVFASDPDNRNRVGRKQACP
jgi:NhaP-type Na+/H+ or K+/H+ antiporter